MKLGFVAVVVSAFVLGNIRVVVGQAESYQVGYAQTSIDLPEQTAIRNVLNENASYKSLSSFEKDFVYYLNYVRLYPKIFAERAVTSYLKAYPSFKPVYGGSLLSQLLQGNAASLLIPDTKLVELARAHAIDVSKHDLMSHNSSDGTPMQKRFEKAGIVCGSECINMLSSGSALEVLLSLLVDYKVQGFGHRKSLLAERMLAVGVGMGSSSSGLQYTVVDLSCDKP